MRRYLIFLSLGVTAALLLIAAVALSQPYNFHGSVIQSPSAAPDFSLPRGTASTFHLADQRGKLVLLFFGYTSCPDVCPTTLADLKQVRQRLGNDADKVQVVFVTVDPDRDTPERTANYAAQFDPSFAGLSGTQAQLGPVWQAYGVYHQLNKKSPSDTTYEVEHSSQVYLLDGSGNLRMTFAFGTPVDDVLADVRQILKKG